MKILIVGSFGIDSIETPFGKAENVVGGSAVYISLAASYFSPSRICGVVGGDFPKEILKLFKEKNIDTCGLEIIENENTFAWKGIYHNDFNTRDTVYTHLNVFENFSPKIPEAYKNSEIICLGNIDPTLQLQVLEQIPNPKFVVCDTMNFWINGKLDEVKKVLTKINVLIINDLEAKELSKENNLFLAAKKILQFGPKILIIKKGENGAILFNGENKFILPAFPIVNVSDPTGAGDCFFGGFVGWLSKTEDFSDKNLRQAIIYANVLASFCVEDFSIRKIQNLTIDEINFRYKEFISYVSLL